MNTQYFTTTVTFLFHCYSVRLFRFLLDETVLFGATFGAI